MMLKINGTTVPESTFQWLRDEKRWHEPLDDPQFNPVHHHPFTSKEFVDHMHQADSIAHVQPGAPGSAESIYYMGDEFWKPLYPLARKAHDLYGIFTDDNIYHVPHYLADFLFHVTQTIMGVSI